MAYSLDEHIARGCLYHFTIAVRRNARSDQIRFASLDLLRCARAVAYAITDSDQQA